MRAWCADYLETKTAHPDNVLDCTVMIFKRRQGLSEEDVASCGCNLLRIKR